MSVSPIRRPEDLPDKSPLKATIDAIPTEDTDLVHESQERPLPRFAVAAFTLATTIGYLPDYLIGKISRAYNYFRDKKICI